MLGGNDTLQSLLRNSVLPALVLAPAVGFAAPLTLTAQTIEPPAVSILLPADTAFTILIDTSEEIWGQLSQFQLFALIEDRSGVAPHPGSLPFIPVEIDYQEAIDPWIGDEVALALLPPSHSQPVDIDNQWLMAAPIAHPDRFEGFIDRIKSIRDDLPTEQVYNGVSILIWQPQAISIPPDAVEFEEELELDDEPPSLLPLEVFQSPTNWMAGSSLGVLPAPPSDFEVEIEPADPSEDETLQNPGLAIAVLPGYLVMADAPEPIQQLIDRQSLDAPVLLDNPNFQRTLANPGFGSSLVVLYGSVLELNKFSLRNSDLSVPDLPIPLPSPIEDVPLLIPEFSEDFAALAQVDATIESFVWLQPEGIGVQARFYPDGPNPAFTAADGAEADRILSLLPAPTYLLMSGRDLAGFWNKIVQFLERQEVTRDGLEQVRMMVTGVTGLDLDSDIMAWMDGEHALVLFPTRQGVISTFAPAVELGMGVIIQTSDRPTAEATFETVEDLLLSWSFLSIEPREVNGEPVVSWGLASDLNLAEQPHSNSYLSRGWVTEDTLAITDGIGSMAELIKPQPYEPLISHSTFRTATQSFPRPNYGYFYINIGSTLSMIYNAFDLNPDDPDIIEVKRFLGALYSISGATSSTAEFTQVNFLLVLAPAQD